MAIEKPWAIFRPGSEGRMVLVHQADKIQDAKYWLMYIAEVGDALFKTKLHPRYSGEGAPAYESHLIKRRESEHNEQKWRQQVGLAGVSLTFVEESPTESPS